VTDREQLTDLLRTYADGVDARDWPLARSVFRDDAVLDYSSVGVETGAVDEVLPRLAALLAPVTLTHHLLSNHEFAIDGDRATTRVALMNPFVVATDERTDVLLFGGRYDDRWQRTAAGWRIVHRTHTGTWHVGPIPGGLSPAVADGPTTTRSTA
jgi:3-phenylpropionate/cinnamic acid dioxygenase small subunit